MEHKDPAGRLLLPDPLPQRRLEHQSAADGESSQEVGGRRALGGHPLISSNIVLKAPLFAAKDSVRLLGARLAPISSPLRKDALSAAISWLCLTHDVTKRRGSSMGYSFVWGWGPPYPETTGYILGTLLDYSKLSGEESLVDRAREMADWEIEIRLPNGGVPMSPQFKATEKTEVFDTGMVIHGWIDAYEHFGDDRYLMAADKAAGLLVGAQDPDGAWRRLSYMDLPHTYVTRVAWALLRTAGHTGDRSTETSARKNLDWALTMQAENGWFRSCNFKPGTLPNTHGIAYTLRGLIEGYALTGHEPYLAAVLTTSEVLMRKLEVKGYFAALFDEEWRAGSTHQCLTGTTQLGLDWLRVFQLTGDFRFLNAGLKAIELGAAHQQWGPGRNVRGALPGSFPIWGGYAPLQFPNWATKFLAEALMLREVCLREAL